MDQLRKCGFSISCNAFLQMQIFFFLLCLHVWLIAEKKLLKRFVIESTDVYTEKGHISLEKYWFMSVCSAEGLHLGQE